MTEDSIPPGRVARTAEGMSIIEEATFHCRRLFSFCRLPSTLDTGERLAFGLVLVAAAVLRLYGLFTWLLANVNEVSALNQVDLPFLSGAGPQTNFLLTTVLLKSVGALLAFPYLRLLTAFTNLFAIYVVYRALRPITPRGVALWVVILLTFSWKVIYNSRLFDCESFGPSVACFFLACTARWVRQPRQWGWLAGAGFLLGLHLNNHVLPCFYTMLLFGAFLLTRCHKKELHFLPVGLVIAAMVIGTIPYVYTTLTFSHFNPAPGLSTKTLLLVPTLPWAINVRHPVDFLMILTEYLTGYPLPSNSPLLGFVPISVLVVLVCLLGKPRDSLKSYLAWMTLGSLVLIGLSPFQTNSEGDLHFFWPHFLLLLCLLCSEEIQVSRIVLGAVAVSILVLNLRWLPYLVQDQVAEVGAVLDAHLEPGERIYVSDGAMLKLEWTSVYSRLEAHPVTNFLCQGPEAFKPFVDSVPEHRALVLQTSDVPWPPPPWTNQVEAVLLLAQEQLMEAREAHGLRIYEIQPRKWRLSPPGRP